MASIPLFRRTLDASDAVGVREPQRVAAVDQIRGFVVGVVFGCIADRDQEMFSEVANCRGLVVAFPL